MNKFLSIVLALSLASPANAITSAQRLALGSRGWEKPFYVTVDTQFDTQRCFIRGLGTIPLGSCLTTTRTESGTGHSLDYAQWKDGHWSGFAANVARLTDFGIEVEAGGSQIFTYSRDLTQAAWVKTTMSSAFTQVGIDNGANSATLLTATSGNALVAYTPTLTQSDTLSFFVKCVTCTGNIQMSSDGISFTTLNSAICFDQYHKGVNLSTTAFARCSLDAQNVTQVDTIKIVNNSDSIVVDGAQLETNAWPTTPMLTTGTAFSRTADQVILSTVPMNALSAVGLNQVSIMGSTANLDTQAAAAGTISVVSVSSGGSQNRVTCRISTAFKPNMLTTVASVGKVSATAAGVFTAGNPAKVGCRFADLNFEALGSNNSGIADTSTAGGMPTGSNLTQASIGALTTTTSPFNGQLTETAWWANQVLSNSQLSQVLH